MNMRNLLVAGASALAVGCFGFGPSASADIITESLAAANSAISPFTGPYQTVTINRTSSTTATITFTSDVVGGNIFLMGDDGQGAAAVNLNATSFTVSNISGSNAGTGFTVGPLTQSSGSMDGFGNFNLAIDDFDGYTHSADTISFDVTDTSGTWASASDVLTLNAGGYNAAAHTFVAAFPADASAGALATGFTGNGTTPPPPPPLPEPATLGIFGIALATLGVIQARKNKQS